MPAKIAATATEIKATFLLLRLFVFSVIVPPKKCGASVTHAPLRLIQDLGG
jgi:hypothetical protein